MIDDMTNPSGWIAVTGLDLTYPETDTPGSLNVVDGEPRSETAWIAGVNMIGPLSRRAKALMGMGTRSDRDTTARSDSCLVG